MGKSMVLTTHHCHPVGALLVIFPLACDRLACLVVLLSVVTGGGGALASPTPTNYTFRVGQVNEILQSTPCLCPLLGDCSLG